MTKNKQAYNAFILSFICIFTYFISYFGRKLINAYSPNMVASGTFSEVDIATLSAVYMYVYACGQLVNGVIGDYVKPKYMTLIGLSLGAIASISFSLTNSFAFRIAMFSLLGFGFSMLRGPIVKLISENTKQNQARLACVFLSFIAYAGPLIAGLFVIWFDWKEAYYISGGACALFAIISFIVFTIFERNGIIKPCVVISEKKKLDVLGVFKIDRFVPYLIVELVVEIIYSSIGGWFNLYLVQRLLFSEEMAGVLYSVLSVVGATCPFVCLALYKLFNNNETLMMRVFLFLSAGCFILLIFIPFKWVDVILFILGLFFTGIASSLIWSFYIPSLGKSGKVSSANGIMDFSGYFGAASITFISGFILDGLGWTGMLIFFAVFVFLGSLTAFLIKPAKVSE